MGLLASAIERYRPALDGVIICTAAGMSSQVPRNEHRCKIHRCRLSRAVRSRIDGSSAALTPACASMSSTRQE